MKNSIVYECTEDLRLRVWEVMLHGPTTEDVCGRGSFSISVRSYSVHVMNNLTQKFTRLTMQPGGLTEVAGPKLSDEMLCYVHQAHALYLWDADPQRRPLK
jgi:hypothetical protein